MRSFGLFSRFGFLLLVLVFVQAQARAQGERPFSINESPLPAPTGFVNDYVGVIDEATKQRLEKRLTDFKNQTNPSVELAVAVVRTTGERPIFDYSLAVARGWGIGSKADDNPSALLFVAIDDRKYFTQVSRDLEGDLPDALVGQLQRQHLVPAFRQGNYAKGIEDTIEAYIRTIEASRGGVAPQASPAEEKRRRPRSGTSGSSLGCCLIALFVLLILLFSRGGGGRGGRGGFGGGGGSVLPWILGSMIASGMSSRGSSGGWGGSSDWGGGGGWGGFGGGGDFGGGGAGGDW